MKINGLGCALVDNLYSPVDFSSEAYKKWSQNERGISIITGGLVFREDLERISGKEYNDILSEITGSNLSSSRNIGGPAIVAMIHIAQILGGTAKIGFFGARADDKNGQYIKDKIESFGINAEGYVVAKGETPFTDVLIDPSFNDNSGERSFINYIGAAGKITGKDIPESFFDGDILVYGGTALTPGVHDDLGYLLKKGRDTGALNFVNTVYDFRNQSLYPNKPWPLVDTDEDYKLIDLLIMDNEEGIKISGQGTKEDALVYFSEKGVHSIIITHGAADILCYSDGYFFEEMGIFNMPVSKSVDIQRLNIQKNATVDTTGCGDNFAGGVYASTAFQLEDDSNAKPSLKQAASWGIVSGGFASLYQGGVYYEKKQGEKLDKIEAMLEEYKRQIGWSLTS